MISKVSLKPGAKKLQKTQNKKHEPKWFSTSAVYRLSRRNKKHCFAKQRFANQTLLDSRTCAKQPINNLSQVTWLCTWLPT